MSDPRYEDVLFRRVSEKREIKKIKPREVKPFPPTSIEHKPTEEEKEWLKQDTYEQISKTYDSIQSSEIKDEENGYFIIETKNNINHPSSKEVLERFDIKVLTHLNPFYCKAFVESPFEKIKEILDDKQLKTIENNIYMIRPLFLTEKIDLSSYDEEWHTLNNNLIIKIVPCVDSTKRRKYLETTLSHIKDLDIKEEEYINKEYMNNMGIIFIKTTISNASKLANENNLIYRIFKTPKIYLSNNNDETIGLSSTSRNINNDLYPVCIVDSGVSDIPQLDTLIINKSYENFFSNGDDEDSHGTPIACLSTFGEKTSDLIASHNIISHKIFSNVQDRGDLIQGMINAIELYKEQTNVFISSVNFYIDDDEKRRLTRFLDKIIQEKNVSVIFSSGNIRDQIDTSNYPQYINNYEVCHPSDALNICSVGSITHKNNSNCYAPLNAPSPFTRVGISNEIDLQDCIKPESVQHGGNLSNDNSFDGIGVDLISNTGTPDEDAGTSFSCPLFGRIVAGTYKKYRRRFNNCETAKSLAYSSCRIRNSTYSNFLGLGESDLEYAINVPSNRVKISFEGILPLDIECGDDEVSDISDEISFTVPNAPVNDIILTLVHSDNYSLYDEKPKLFTYLYVRVFKPGRRTPKTANYTIPGLKSNVKKMTWSLSRGIVGRWNFSFEPRSIEIPKGERNDVTIRYGGTIELRSRTPPIGTTLTNMFKEANGL